MGTLQVWIEPVATKHGCAAALQRDAEAGPASRAADEAPSTPRAAANGIDPDQAAEASKRQELEERGDSAGSQVAALRKPEEGTPGDSVTAEDDSKQRRSPQSNGHSAQHADRPEQAPESSPAARSRAADSGAIWFPRAFPDARIGSAAGTEPKQEATPSAASPASGASGNASPQIGGCGECRDMMVHFSVRDTGIGISKDDIGLLFQSFSQVTTNLNLLLKSLSPTSPPDACRSSTTSVMM